MKKAESGVSVKSTLAADKATEATAILTDRDILNVLHRHCVKDLAGRTEMRALVDEICGESIRYSVQLSSDGSSAHLPVEPADTVVATAELQDVVRMDSTYRTNRYNMPLLYVVSQTNTGKSFTISVFHAHREGRRRTTNGLYKS